jgi:hypothetical protein
VSSSQRFCTLPGGWAWHSINMSRDSITQSTVHLTRAVNALSAEWRTKVEAEARSSEKSQSTQRACVHIPFPQNPQKENLKGLDTTLPAGGAASWGFSTGTDRNASQALMAWSHSVFFTLAKRKGRVEGHVSPHNAPPISLSLWNEPYHPTKE